MVTARHWSLLAVLLLTGCEQPIEANTSRGQPSRVVVEPVVVSMERTRLEAVGTSRALRSIILYPATSGEVTSVHFQPGKFVEQGKVLVELDQRDARLAVDLAKVRLVEAERTFERYRSSAAVGATIPSTLDAAQTELEAARIELDRARVNLDDRTIEAPFAGHVGITEVDAGDRIQPGTPITTLDDRSVVMVSFSIPEILIGKVTKGDQVAISTWTVGGSTSSGEVVEIDSRIDPQTRTFVARAAVDNKADALRPGMSFRVTLDLSGDPYPVLSEIAVQWGANGAFVWSVVDGKASRVPVNIVQRQRGKVLVDATLRQGDLVVVEGVQRLRPGASVAAELITAVNATEIQAAVPGPG